MIVPTLKMLQSSAHVSQIGKNSVTRRGFGLLSAECGVAQY